MKVQEPPNKEQVTGNSGFRACCDRRPAARRLLPSASLVLLLVSLCGGCSEPASVQRTQQRSRVDVPPAGGDNDFYVSNRPPLLPSPLIKLPVGAVRPRGWLKQQMVFMKEGMVGNLPLLSHWCNPEGSAWNHPEGRGANGWEELPYWLRGYGNLGYILEDEKIIKETKAWIESVLASQEKDGYFGPRVNKARLDLWPNMIMLDALKSYYEATGDGRILPFMTRYFQWQLELPEEKFLPGSWQKIRAGDNLHSVYWLYNLTGEKWLLELAEKIHRNTVDWTSGIPSWHGVNICQGFREPAQFYQQSKDAEHLNATLSNYHFVMQSYGQVPGGMFAADENARPGFVGPRQAAETCSMIEFMRSFEILLSITGDPIFADRCEEVAFNSLPPAQTPDLKGLHYLTCPNMVNLDRTNKSPGIQNPGCMFPYSPGEHYRCCQHNVSQGWPYFTEHLWMATKGNGLAAVLYASSEVQAKVGDGTMVTIAEKTEYPFKEIVDFQVQISKPTHFPLMFRIPTWCHAAKIFLNDNPLEQEIRGGAYYVVERTWTNNDQVRLLLPMSTRIKIWEKNKHSASVYRGPLAFSLKIKERWEKVIEEGEWAVWEVFPESPWNYGLVLPSTDGETLDLEIVENKGPLADQPFDLESAPLVIQATGRRIPAWDFEEDGLVGRLQKSPVFTEQPDEAIELIPMGCARLRISAFPVVGQDGEGHRWRKLPPRFSASLVHGYLSALHDGMMPRNSRDKYLPLFSWWDHRGSTEWVAYGFERQELSEVFVYWYEDAEGGRFRAPASWRLLYKDGQQWAEVSNPSPYLVELDQFNHVTFDPVITDEIRLEVNLQDGFSAGILEWRVS